MPKRPEASLPAHKLWIPNVCLQAAAFRGNKPKHTLNSEEIAPPDAQLIAWSRDGTLSPPPAASELPSAVWPRACR